ncbi:cation-translocating P-type ATPase [Pseudonocardia yunnanensis]|uniref:HAD-IC family P-type ATPase n=1 Tax=Pseudonocardia yunnanensis TaxID=58107 RepID=A0ABW4EQQ5_9PSEU
MLQSVFNLAGSAVGTVLGAANGVAELAYAATCDATTVAPGRVHVPLRGVHTSDAAIAAAVEEQLAEHPAVRRAEVNAALGHVMVEFDPDLLPVSDALDIVADVERENGLASEPYTSQEHPGNARRALQEAALLGIHAAALVYTTVGRAVPAAPVALPASVLALIDASPRLRGYVAGALGEPTADALLSTGAALSNGLGKRPIGLIVDACQRFVLYQENQARRRVWTAWEDALADQEGAHRAMPRPVGPRPAPMPPGPVEKVADQTPLAALGGAAALLAATRSVPLATTALALGAPKAARSGREGFAAQLGRDAAAKGTLVLDRNVLRRLDRVDTVVLDEDVLLAGHQAVDDVIPLAEEPGSELSELVERAHDLVDLRRPLRARANEGWSVGPTEPEPTGRLGEVAAVLGRRSSTLLTLRRGGEPVALIGVSPALDPFAESVVASATRAGLVLVGGPRELSRRLELDGAVPGGAALMDSVRALQTDGHVVAVVSRNHRTALVAADVGIGVVGPRKPPPWTADVLTRTATEVCLLLDAIGVAQQVSRRSAQLAVGGSGLGGLLAVLGPPTGAAGRAAIPVHTAALVALGLGTWSGISLARRPGPIPADRTPWHAMSAHAVLQSLHSARTGLTEHESQLRQRDRPSIDDQHEVGLTRASLEELANPLTPALAAGAGVSAATGSILDPLLITTVLAVNALIGGVQRVGAQRALRTLRKSSAARVHVRRGESDVELRADQLVEGDVIRLQTGDAVPADSRVLTGHDLEIDESSLTGESVPVAKSNRATSARAIADRSSMLYEGTVVAVGRTDAVVVATGDHTEAGRALRQTGEQAPPTGVETRLRKLTARALPISIGAGVVLVVSDLLRRRPAGIALTRAVSLAVAAVPEGLPFVATVAELAAARRLSARGALVRNPSTIEALGRVNVLCFDKTGTLTEGRISLRQVSDGTDTVSVDEPLRPDLQDVIATAVRASPFRADPHQVTHQTDRAVLRGAHTLGVSAENGHAVVEQLDELPFESRRAYHATLWRGRTGTRISLKGAPEVVLPLCSARRRNGETQPLDEQACAVIDEEVHRLALQGHRVLAVAQRRITNRTELTEDDVTELEFRGLVALVDPVRPTAAQAVATLRAAGVEIAMITGDHPSTAQSIASELDALNGRTVMTGTELEELTDSQLVEALPRAAVFARVSPAQKARIVRLYQQRGLAVAVTGDGTNDAPAIRLADVGIALGARATAAAREAADVVVTDDRIETITDAIVEGRGMWTSVRDALSILLGGNLGEIAYTLATGIAGSNGGLNARQLLLINLLTDVLPAMAVAVRPPADATPEQLLAEGPEQSLGGALTRDIEVRAAITATSAGIAWLLARPVSTAGQASTTGLVALVGAQLGQTLAVRGRTPLVAAAVAGSMVLLAVAVQVPGLSRVVGSQPLLPHQWAIALSASVGATGAQLVAQRLLTGA